MPTPSISDWRAAVYQHRGPHVGNGVRVLLLYLGDRMGSAYGPRTVSVPRNEIAAALAVSPREVTYRIRAAKDAGFLDEVVRARPQTTAVYQGLFPDREGTPGSPLTAEFRGAGNHTSETRFRGDPGVPPNSRQPLDSAVRGKSPRGRGKTQQQEAGGVPERSDAERSEGLSATVHNGWCLAGCGTALVSAPGRATGYCNDHRKDTAA